MFNAASRVILKNKRLPIIQWLIYLMYKKVKDLFAIIFYYYFRLQEN